MADFTSSPMGAEYISDSQSPYQTGASPNVLTTLANVAGAGVSFALVIGIGIWGYQLLVRDVTGIPVVRAASGEMRVRPENPGGELAKHQGLSVNVVAAEGTAGKPADELHLAPKPVDLLPEDGVLQAAVIAPELLDLTRDGQVAVLNTLDVAAALNSGNVDDLVAQLTRGVTPLSDLSADTNAVVASLSTAVIDEVRAAEAQVAAAVDAPGVRQSLRPKRRPAVRAVVIPAAMSVANPATVEVDAASLPVGTRLAQLGAFDSAEVAREQWDVMQGRFGDYMGDKRRIVQKATSGGRVFYRLRVMGFADIGEARRFCSALVAENADCIPVVTR
jgi:hypothetical protein